MIADPHPPVLVIDGIVCTFLARVASTLECVADERARGPSTVALANEDRVGSVSEMVDIYICAGLVGTNAIARRRGKAETVGRHCVRVRFECYHRVAVG